MPLLVHIPHYWKSHVAAHMSKAMVVEASVRSKVMILFSHCLLLLPLRVGYFCVVFCLVV